jgi:Domain of unknown function (DUF3817)
MVREQLRHDGGFAEPGVGEILDSSNPTSMLQRKVTVTKVIAVIEVLSYAALLVPMYRRHIMHDNSTGNYLVLRTIAYFHGMLCIAFGVMVIDIHRVLGWSKWFLLATLAGPFGAIVAHLRLSRSTLPTAVNGRDFFLFSR